MAKRVRIASVQGNTAITADGERIEIIGNARVNSGSYVWTDGVVAYGYVPTGGEYKRTRKKLGGILPMFPYYRQIDFDYNWFAMFSLKSPFSDLARREYYIGHTTYGEDYWRYQCWYGRPYQCNAGNKPIAFRGSFNSPQMFNAAGEIINNAEWDISKRLYLCFDGQSGYYWQKGSYCQTWNNWHLDDYYKVVQYHFGRSDLPDKQWKYEYYVDSWKASDFNEFRDIQIAIGNADKTDLKIIFGKDAENEEAVSLQNAVNQMLVDAKNRIYNACIASLPQGKNLNDCYPVALPEPKIFGYWLGTNTSETDDIFRGSKECFIVDNDAGQGGCPLVDIASIYQNETGEIGYSPENADARQILALRNMNGVLEFYLKLDLVYCCYGYSKDLDYDNSNEYIPAANSNNWIFGAGYIDDNGNFDDDFYGLDTYYKRSFIYKVTLNGSIASINCVQDWALHPDSRSFKNDYVWQQVDIDNGYVSHNGTRLQGNWLWVKDIIAVDDKSALVIGYAKWQKYDEDNQEWIVVEESAIALYDKDDRLVFIRELHAAYDEIAEASFEFGGDLYNPNYSLVPDKNLFVSQFDRLKNTGYYRLNS